MTLDPEITAIMTKSEDYDELKWAWEQWRDKSGKKMRTEYKKYVDLVNKAAKLNGNYYKLMQKRESRCLSSFTNLLGKINYGEMWRESYEDDKFVENVDKMWSQVEPLYKELHTYVRRKLQKIYDKDMDKNSDLIPAHLLGNMWVS